jgi:hypothetical protein|uniref:Uncharacterized protein n=1 Tax=viral metagenome TaxID=1070528 RepID=A0A6C0EQF2_9ZZZZ
MNYKTQLTKDIIESYNLYKNNMIKNNIHLDLLNMMKNDYLNKTNYNDFINSSKENQDIYFDIYTKIFDIQIEQKNLEKNYELLLPLI